MSDQKRLGEIFRNGILDENPTFRMVLGMCPTLAISTAVNQGIGMGLATMFVLVWPKGHRSQSPSTASISSSRTSRGF